MKTSVRFSAVVLLLILGAPMLEVHAEPASPGAGGDVAFFEKKIRPLLAERCYSCHSADTKPSGGLRVDDRNGLLMGGDAGPAVIPGNPDKSLILQRIISENAKRRMPKDSDPLTESEIADLKVWIEGGMAWPRERIPASIGRKREDFDELKQSHWAWQPLSKPAVPEVADKTWPRENLDRFVLAKLEAEKLPPVADADAATLIRRVTYDLTGLPPTPQEVDAFVENANPQALEQAVDRLLGSRAFAERWARHWLDVARYGESTGPSRNIPYPHAWKYRDYVLDAVNRDVPYDRFIQEQIAGDLLPADSPAERDRLLTATGFLALGVKDVNQRFKTRFIMDNVDEQIDAVTRSVLGLTVNCARCHDHKFDPIPTTDYYALAGIFTSTDDCAGVKNKMGGGGLDYYVPSMLVKLSGAEVDNTPAEQLESLKAKVEAAKLAFEEIRGTPEGLKPAADGRPTQRGYRAKFEKLQGELLSLTDPASRGFAVHGVRESKTVADTEVRIRGEAERLGPSVPRGFLTAFEVPGAPAINPAQSGRLELSQWLTSPNNPLTPRVIVNRVWQHLFGQGIVTTVDNFGVKGDLPSHPELLDHLADEFVKGGWSVKKLVRTIVLSRAYGLSSDAPASHKERDPGNRLVWKHTPRRLDAEEMRDAMLQVAGRLQATAPEASAASVLKMIEMRDNGVEAKTVNEKADSGLFRSLYLPLLRGVTPKTLAAFDPVSQTLVTGQRDSTTVPTQALFMLNSTFVRSQSLALAESVLASGSSAEGSKISEVYQRALGRRPTEQETTRAEAFLAEYEASYNTDVPVLLASAETAATPSLDESGATSSSGDAAASLPPVPVIPANPDDVDRTTAAAKEEVIQPSSPRAAAWMSFIQALYASAEFRFVR